MILSILHTWVRTEPKQKHNNLYNYGFYIYDVCMTNLPQLSNASEELHSEALTITEDLSLMRVFQHRAAQGEPTAVGAALSILGRKTHRVIRETVFGFRVPADQ